jgi:hypothetical protein
MQLDQFDPPRRHPLFSYWRLLGVALAGAVVGMVPTTFRHCRGQELAACVTADGFVPYMIKAGLSGATLLIAVVLIIEWQARK